jgi:hypothetical protein
MTATPLAVSQPAAPTRHLRLFVAVAIVLIAMAIAFAVGRSTVDATQITLVPATAPAAQSFACPRAGVC